MPINHTHDINERRRRTMQPKPKSKTKRPPKHAQFAFRIKRLVVTRLRNAMFNVRYWEHYGLLGTLPQVELAYYGRRGQPGKLVPRAHDGPPYIAEDLGQDLSTAMGYASRRLLSKYLNGHTCEFPEGSGQYIPCYLCDPETHVWWNWPALLKICTERDKPLLQERLDFLNDMTNRFTTLRAAQARGAQRAIMVVQELNRDAQKRGAEYGLTKHLDLKLVRLWGEEGDAA